MRGGTCPPNMGSDYGHKAQLTRHTLILSGLHAPVGSASLTHHDQEVSRAVCPRAADDQYVWPLFFLEQQGYGSCSAPPAYVDDMELCSILGVGCGKSCNVAACEFDVGCRIVLESGIGGDCGRAYDHCGESGVRTYSMGSFVEIRSSWF
jgi:hypothetical protein